MACSSRAKVRVRSFPLSAPKRPGRGGRRERRSGAKFGCRADRWHGCSAYRDISGIVLDTELPFFRAARPVASDAFGQGRTMRLIAEDLGGERGGQPVFSGVAFALGKGDALVVTGANGSGKSTLLRVVAGLLPQAAGSVRLEGGGEAFPTADSAAHYLGHLNAMKPTLTVTENLRLLGRFLRRGPNYRRGGAGDGRARRDRPSALRLPLHRPAKTRGDREAAGQPATAVAARRADGRARCGVGAAVFHASGEAPSGRRDDRRRHPYAARDRRGEGTEDGGDRPMRTHLKHPHSGLLRKPPLPLPGGEEKCELSDLGALPLSRRSGERCRAKRGGVGDRPLTNSLGGNGAEC